VHYENGKYHLHIDLINASKEKPSKQNVNSVYFGVIQQPIQEEIHTLKLSPHSTVLLFTEQQLFDLMHFSNIQTPPPKVALLQLS
jgi:hypothetical protein